MAGETEKKKQRKKGRLTWINLLQIATVAALLAYMQIAVTTGRDRKSVV